MTDNMKIFTIFFKYLGNTSKAINKKTESFCRKSFNLSNKNVSTKKRKKWFGMLLAKKENGIPTRHENLTSNSFKKLYFIN